ncbi:MULTISPECIES: GNAT family N-acetyltransferase [unclassified Fusibacter]|uniref:GNAT family N-acetyltransferase n=1 Tax=unclassified Fusibacter TaxID=2624464 RepID=UPI001012DE08|nr:MULTISPECIES: GNAT family N-acetyltransferase [unclassified Fusibacter]MCK8060376.1 GNAT family N-acetyltransferase [Fusibacter sp. A2]NPE20335.1 GNAT family N-acetyltransferase [Fusibacter sp. A1]RXV63541.1 N-acetyltransferase [Fusibacter sp. A1]
MKIEYVMVPKSSMDIAVLYDALGWLEQINITSHQLKMTMVQSYYVLYAYHGDQLIGTGRVVSDGIINAYICGVGVLEPHRGLGIGKEISRRLVDHCRSNKLHIQLVCKDNLVDYYKKLEFETMGTAMKISADHLK